MSARNKPCYCGSGIKFKRCCMESPAAKAHRYQKRGVEAIMHALSKIKRVDR